MDGTYHHQFPFWFMITLPYYTPSPIHYIIRNACCWVPLLVYLPTFLLLHPHLWFFGCAYYAAFLPGLPATLPRMLVRHGSPATFTYLHAHTYAFATLTTSPSPFLPAPHRHVRSTAFTAAHCYIALPTPPMVRYCVPPLVPLDGTMYAGSTALLRCVRLCCGFCPFLLTFF